MPFPARTVSRAATAGAALASLAAYPFLPKRVPSHFDLEGRADRTSSRTAVTFGFPAMLAGFWVFFDRFSAWPGRNDREDAAEAAQAREEMTAATVVTMALIHGAILARAAGLPVDMDRTSRGVLGGLMLVTGNIMPRLPRSMIGIRTPWTLADPTVWERTHRLGGYLSTAAGLITLATLPSSRPWARRIPPAALIGSMTVATIYSYREWSKMKK